MAMDEIPSLKIRLTKPWSVRQRLYKNVASGVLVTEIHITSIVY